MLVNRRTFNIKQGCLEKAANLLKQEGENSDFQGVSRLYAPEIAPFDTLILEIEFEDLKQYQDFWWGFSGSEAFWEEWFSLTKDGGTNEVWRLLE